MFVIMFSNLVVFMFVANDAPKCLKEVVTKIQSCGLHALVQISNLAR
jgi:hypothetical protein